MKKIPMLERFAAQSLVEHDGELIFSKEKFAELIVRDTLDQVAEFSRLTKAYQTQGIDPEIDVTREVLKNYGFTRFPRS